MGVAGPSVTHLIPHLMNNLLAYFQPPELVDFMNFIGLLIHKLPSDMFDVLDRLNGPLYTHMSTTLSSTPSGTDEVRAQIETQRAYIGLLSNTLAARLQNTLTSERAFSLFSHY